MNIVHNIGEGFFIEKEVNGTTKVLAELTYLKKGNILVANHTFVSEELWGQGIAVNLFNEIVKYARDNNFKIDTTCSYVVKKLDNEKYNDIKI